MKLTPTEEIQLVALWNRRTTLTAREWEQFAQLVIRRLNLIKAIRIGKHRIPLDQIASHLDKEDIINGFIVEKILQGNLSGTIERVEIIVTYFTRYAIDVYRSNQIRTFLDKGNTKDSSHDSDSESKESSTDPLQGHLESLDWTNKNIQNTESTDEDHIPDEKEKVPKGLITEDTIFEEVAEERLTKRSSPFHQHLYQQARQWLTVVEPWISNYLAYHLCPEAEEAIPLSTLAKMRSIKSYDHKARQLGITGEKGGFFAGYEKTLLGQWMVQCGIEVAQARTEYDIREQMQEALKMLCAAALEQLRASNHP